MPLGLDKLEGMMPKMAVGMGFITWILIIIILIIVGGIVGFIIIQRKKFKYKIIIFEKVDGKFQPARKDRAMELKVGRMGHICLYLQKHRVHRVMPKIQTGKRTYWFFIREDGQWINFGPGDFDNDSKKLGAHMIDVDMRMADAQLEGALKTKYDNKPKIWAQYGTVIISIGFIVIVAVMAWFLFDKWIEIASTINSGMETTDRVLENLNTILARMDNVCSGGSGIKVVE